MKRELAGMPKIFAFTFRQHVRGKGYRAMTLVLGLVCLILPALIMVLTATSGGSGGESGAVPPYRDGAIGRVLVVDTGAAAADYDSLNYVGYAEFSGIAYEMADSVEAAIDQTGAAQDVLILEANTENGGIGLQLLLPENSGITEDDMACYQSFLQENYAAVQVSKSGLDEGQLAALMTPTQTEVVTAEEEPQDDLALAREILGMLLPYGVIMVLYFMILAYGQGVANSVLMEKTSKLMDMFLVTVRPGAMMLGKVLAGALCGILQLLFWVVCLVLSFSVGTAMVQNLAPESDLILIQLFELFGSAGELFTPAGIVLAVLIILGGFLLYCALSAMGGAMASKPEDLSNTNVIFTLVLIASFFAVLFGSSTMGGGGYTWQLYVPFTAMMALPGMVLLGEVSIGTACVSLGIMLVCTVAMILLAGKVYRVLILRKGAPLSPGKLLKLLRSGKAS